MIRVCACEAPRTEPVARCGLPVGHDGGHQVYYRDRLLDWPWVSEAPIVRRLEQRAFPDAPDALPDGPGAEVVNRLAS